MLARIQLIVLSFNRLRLELLKRCGTLNLLLVALHEISIKFK